MKYLGCRECVVFIATANVHTYCWWPLERPYVRGDIQQFLAAEAIQSTSLALERIHNIHGRDCLPLGMLGVGDSVADDVLQEHLEHTTGLLLDETADTLHSTTTSQTTDGRLGDTLDVITQDFPVTLGATLSKSLASLATASHTCSL